MLEYRPGSPEPVQLHFLGDDVRDTLYPNGSHQAFESFGSAPSPTSISSDRPQHRWYSFIPPHRYAFPALDRGAAASHDSLFQPVLY